VLLNEETTKQYFGSSQHNSTLFYIFTSMTTCFGHWTIMLPYSKFCKDGLMMVKGPKHVVIKVKIK
jgi:hypothetical protein